MKLKYLLPSLGLITSTFTLSTSQRISSQVRSEINRPVATLANDVHLREIVTDTFSRKFSDEIKIINYNKLLKKYGHSNGNYVIVDKKACQARIYSPDGDVLYKCEVALGRHIGDKRSGGYMVPGAKLLAYTTPGEFEIAREGSKNASSKKLYGDRVLAISGDHTQQAYKKTQILALHRVPATPMGRLRENVFNNGTLKDNRCSFGCVNFMVESYDKMRSLIKGITTKVYILPEEKGNSLQLVKQKNGTYKFVQTKYRTEAMEHNKSNLTQNRSSVVNSTKITNDTTKNDSIIVNFNIPKSSDTIIGIESKPILDNQSEIIVNDTSLLNSIKL